MFKEVLKSVLPALVVGMALAILWHYCERELVDYAQKTGGRTIKFGLLVLSLSWHVHLVSFLPLFFWFLSWKERMYLSLPISMVTMFSIGGPFAAIIVAALCSYKIAKQYKNNEAESF